MKMEIHLGAEYRMVSNGFVYRIQESITGSPWTNVPFNIYIPFIETTWLWLARWKIKQLRKAETRRAIRYNAIWETIE